MEAMAPYEQSPRRVDSPFASSRCVDSQKPQRRLPPPLPSRSLFSLEKMVPLKPSFEQLSERSWDSTPSGSSKDVNKPLPKSPTHSRTSSVYSGGSGYTRIIESYGNDDEIPPMPAMVQPIAYRDTAVGLLPHKGDVPWYAEVSKIEDRALRASQSIPALQYAPFRDERWNASAHEFSQAPAFSEFRNRMPEPISPPSPGSLQHRSSYGFLSPPLVSPPLVYPDHHLSFNHERQYLPGPMSASVTEIVDAQLVPQPLRTSQTASMFFGSHSSHRTPSSVSVVKHVELLDIKEAQRRAVEAKQRDLEARATEYIARKSNVRQSNLIDLEEAQRRRAYEKLQKTSAPYEEHTEPRPGSASSDSFVIYTGVRESFKAMVKHKLKQKKESRELEKVAKVQERERKRIMSVAKETYPAMKESPRASQDQARKYSWTGSSGRTSLTDGVSNLFRSLSILRTEKEEENNRGRNMERGRRPKQLAVLPSPYQKYGAAIWFAKNKKARKDLRARGDVHRAPIKKPAKRFVTKRGLGERPVLKKKRSENVKEAYQQGASHLRTVLGVDGVATKDKDKKSRGRSFGRTMSEVRRERLKRSIAVLGPARQPVVTPVDGRWL